MASRLSHSPQRKGAAPSLGLEPAATQRLGALGNVGAPLGHTSHRAFLPFVSVTHYNMDHYSLTDPGGMEGRDGHVGWRLNHKVVTHPASSLAQDRESSPAETSVPPTVQRRQLIRLDQWLNYWDRGAGSLN